MPLARHVDTEELLKLLNDNPVHKSRGKGDKATLLGATPFSSRYSSKIELPKFRIPHDGEQADVVHQLLRDQLALDGVSATSRDI
jgi:glutamate decarboxylase